MAATRHLGILLSRGVAELDAVGPWEVAVVLDTASDDGHDVLCVSTSGDLVTCAEGLVVQAQHSYPDAPALMSMVCPGGQGTRSHLGDDAPLDWVRRQRKDVALMTSASRTTGAWHPSRSLAGTDMALHLLSRLAGEDRARQSAAASSTTPSPF